MKRIILALVLALAFTNASAKKIRFAVDMGTHTVSTMGVHLMGDFQAYLGLPGGDWQPNTLRLPRVGTSTVYDTILDLPAFNKYEFKFLSGHFGYEAEFVPNVARVEPFLFNDNRWLYLDSLSNDTAFVGIIPFSGTAPAGKSLLRFMVDMSSVITSTNGVHVAGTFQSSTWNTKDNILYSFGGGIYEIIAYAVNGNYSFKYYNGNTAGTTETVPGPCATAGNRTHNLIKDTILETVCFSACVSCALAGMNEYTTEISNIKLFPNPATHSSIMEFENKDVDYSISVTDLTGRVLRIYTGYKGEAITIRKDDLNSGLYFVNVTDSRNAKASSKLIIE
jgi:hypothetical protein